MAALFFKSSSTNSISNDVCVISPQIHDTTSAETAWPSGSPEVYLSFRLLDLPDHQRSISFLDCLTFRITRGISQFKRASGSPEVYLVYLSFRGVRVAQSNFFCRPLFIPFHLGHSIVSPSRIIASENPFGISTPFCHANQDK